MHNPTNWQDYPSTDTPITAAQMKRIDGDATQAYNAIDCIAGRTFSGIVTETVTENEGIASNAMLLISDSDITDSAGAIVRRRSGGNSKLVPMVDYHMEYVVGFGTFLRFPSTSYFEIGDIVTAQIYMPIAISPPITQAEYDAMSYHDPNTYYVIEG